MLLTDHELAASTLAARVAASVRADPYAVVGTGLGAMSGVLHGGASLGVETLIAAARGPQDVPRVAGMVPGAGEAVFAVARTAGWIAHALEAYAGGGPLRPRAVYTGPPAIIDP